MSQSNMNTATSINLNISQISIEQISQLNEFRFFYLQPNDNNFYHNLQNGFTILKFGKSNFLGR